MNPQLAVLPAPVPGPKGAKQWIWTCIIAGQVFAVSNGQYGSKLAAENAARQFALNMHRAVEYAVALGNQAEFVPDAVATDVAPEDAGGESVAVRGLSLVRGDNAEQASDADA